MEVFQDLQQFGNQDGEILFLVINRHHHGNLNGLRINHMIATHSNPSSPPLVKRGVEGILK
jgi:hypothetical protein